MPKILFIMSSFNVGGMETSMLRIANNLRFKNMDVSFLITKSKGDWFEKLTASKFDIYFIDNYCQLIPWFHALKVGRFLVNNKFDVVFNVFDEVSQSVLSLIDNTTSVVPLLRNDHPDIYRVGLANSERWNLAIGNSNKIAFEAKKILPNKNIKVIANSTFVPDTIKEKLIEDWKNEIRLIFVGRLVNESKGIFILPEILHDCIVRDFNVKLTIVGDGVDKQTLYEMFKDKNLLDSVCFVGLKDSDEVSKLLLNSHILLFTSHYEGLPNVVMEAMAHGCIPIVSDLPMITDMLIENHENGFVVNIADVKKYVDVIGYLINNSEEAIAIASEARKTIRESFGYENETIQYLNVINDLIDGKYSLVRDRYSFIPVDFDSFEYKKTIYLFTKQKLYKVAKKLGLR